MNINIFKKKWILRGLKGVLGESGRSRVMKVAVGSYSSPFGQSIFIQNHS